MHHSAMEYIELITNILQEVVSISHARDKPNTESKRSTIK